MGIYIRVTDKALIDAITNMRGTQELTSNKSLLELCPKAHSIHYQNGVPVGFLVESGEEVDGLRLTEKDIIRFGVAYDLHEPNRRTVAGKLFQSLLDRMKHTTRVACYALDLIAPRIKSKLIIDEFGFDYKSQARIHFVSEEIYIGIVGVSTLTPVEQANGLQFLKRDEYRAAVKGVSCSKSNLLFGENDSLVVRSQLALAPFITLELSEVNALLSDIYQRVCVDPSDVRHYIPQLLLDRELTYVFTTLVGILHAFHGVE